MKRGLINSERTNKMKRLNFTSAPEFITEFLNGISNPILSVIFHLAYAIGVMIFIVVVVFLVIYFSIKGLVYLKIIRVENKQLWYNKNNKTPTVWTWIAFGFFLIMLFVFFNTIVSKIKQDNSVKQISEQQKEENKQQKKGELEQKVNLLRADMIENINKEVGNMFAKSYIEHISENYFRLTLTVEDDWYYLKEFQQERLLEDAWQYFNSLGNKYGLRQENDLAWEVIFIDTYKKQLLKKGW